MNKLCHIPTFYRLGSAILLFSFIITGCAGFPTEIRHDDSTRKYSLGKDEKANTYTNPNKSGESYTIGQHDDATEHYILRKGNPSDPPTGVIQTKTVVKPETKQTEEGKPSLEKQIADMPMVLEVTDVLFEFDKWVIKETFIPELDRWVAFFQNNPQVTAEIYGHTDSTGTTMYNQKLSERRAQAVINYLVGKGVDQKRLTAKGFGESQPADLNTTKEGRQKNRRVEMNL